ncbi:hypothetical protein [Desulfofundulus salinus]|uniref:Uncharacterized protein n=1 Tax=Desulfofundulus salinus TaxID=2419843 RepID=A0A494WTG1_9FIRM|nr:hypothetical protein [Desulfofundulus salinum]RKO66231.1 hypothetical protein D7024_04265 [Desulfofundulus salinum]
MSDPARKSLLIYTGISLTAALLFLLATYATGISYPPVARIGGAVWVFILSMIITMPIVISHMNKRHI